MWEPQWRALADDFHLIRLDFSGFGRSPMHAGEGCLRDEALRVLDALGVQRAIVVGASLGAMVALELAIDAPERVQALVLVGAGLADRERPDAERAYEEAETAAIRANDFDLATELNLETWIAGPGRRVHDVNPAICALAREMLETSYALQLAFDGQASISWLEPPVSARLDEIDAPTLVITGEHDQPSIQRSSDTIAATIRGAQRDLIDGTAHLASLERPDVFDRLLRPFLLRCAP
jgi:3-oxoadipate enol-lactonase